MALLESSFSIDEEIDKKKLETRLTIKDDDDEEAAADDDIVTASLMKKLQDSAAAAADELAAAAAAAADKLASSLIKKLEVGHRLPSSQPSIFKIPDNLRVVNEKSYIPQTVSIGPIHHKKSERYETMENHKFHYLQQFLNHKGPSTTLQDCAKACVRMLKRYEEEARECYADDIKLKSDEFVEMMVLDGCFIVELFLRKWRPELRGSQYDPLFDQIYLLNMVREDLVLLENQLPFFVLDALFNFINNTSHSQKLWEISFLNLALKFFNRKDKDASTLENPNHLLDLKYKTTIPSQIRANDGESLGRDGAPRTLPTATQLREAGVKFKAAQPGTHLLDIKFQNKTLEIPTIKVEDQTERLFRNMIAYEQCCGERSYMAHYFSVIDDLISSPSDVALLKRKGIVTNWLGDDEEVSNMVNKMGKNVYVSSKHFHYKDLYKQLNDHYHTPWHRRQAKLKHDYFNSPWSLVAFLAAFAVLICTFIQTVCSIVQTVKH
ncbi:hypothetical protein Scep_008450 [Stephania cephalantha]|uniref:Uncharacterized protein n=1 Tax=Stephania cephalantha TaxID=152367 RepID=A0AAP0PM32_9MAGN